MAVRSAEFSSFRHTIASDLGRRRLRIPISDQSFDDTALRAAIDLRDAYEATVSLWRELDAVSGRVVWKTVKGRDYLYHDVMNHKRSLSRI